MADSVKKYKNKQSFQIKILKLDTFCRVDGCENQSVAGHHIVYKSKWSTGIENAVGHERDSFQNGIGLCAKHHYSAHNGLGIGQMSGREFMFKVLDGFVENSVEYHRWKAVKNELMKSLIRKGVIK